MVSSTTKKQRGQFFTVSPQVQKIMVSLLQNPARGGKLLEPSAGAGHLLAAALDAYPDLDAIGWELDNSIAPLRETLPLTYGNFFELSNQYEGAFDSILGNPPYVAYKEVEEDTRRLAASTKMAYQDKANLYYLFMDRCLDLLKPGGEMVLIVPKEWLYSTSAQVLRQRMLSKGTLTHIIDLGEEKVFPDADVPAIIICRFERTSTHQHEVRYSWGLDQHAEEVKELVVTPSGSWLFLSPARAMEVASWGGSTLGDFFEVRVGMVSGADSIYNVSRHPSLSLFQKEGTVVPMLTTKGIEQYLEVNDYQHVEDIPEHTREYLLSHKETLISRRIMKFHEGNWWRYGAIRNKQSMLGSEARLYVLGRSRKANPFFLEPEAKLFGGGILGLFAKEGAPTPEEMLPFLHSDLFRELCVALGITTANKVSFQPTTLATIPFHPHVLSSLSSSEET